MSDQPEHIDNILRATVIEVIHHVQANIQWKSGKSVQHLSKRIRLGHLPTGTTLAEYESLIAAILNDNEAKLYLLGVFHFSRRGVNLPPIDYGCVENELKE